MSGVGPGVKHVGGGCSHLVCGAAGFDCEAEGLGRVLKHSWRLVQRFFAGGGSWLRAGCWKFERKSDAGASGCGGKHGCKAGDFEKHFRGAIESVAGSPGTGGSAGAGGAAGLCLFGTLCVLATGLDASLTLFVGAADAVYEPVEGAGVFS